MSKRLMSLLIILGVVIVLVLALAAWDGGREEPRAIEQPVDLEAVRAGSPS